MPKKTKTPEPGETTEEDFKQAPMGGEPLKKQAIRESGSVRERTRRPEKIYTLKDLEREKTKLKLYARDIQSQGVRHKMFSGTCIDANGQHKLVIQFCSAVARGEKGFVLEMIPFAREGDTVRLNPDRREDISGFELVGETQGKPAAQKLIYDETTKESFGASDRGILVYEPSPSGIQAIRDELIENAVESGDIIEHVLHDYFLTHQLSQAPKNERYPFVQLA